MSRALIILCSVVALIAHGSSENSQPDDLPPPEIKQIASTWIGFDEDGLKFYRLELRQDGHGYCATCFTDNPAKLYSVRGWSMEGFSIRIDLLPVDKAAEQIRITGEASNTLMLLNVEGSQIGWKKRLTLHKEADLQERNNKARKRIETSKLSKPSKR